LGYTLYTRTGNGDVVRIDPARALRDGDPVRLLLETNEDSYLYIFNTDDRGAKPVMIFPDHRLNGGANFVRAHVPQEIPSSKETDPSLRWLHLDGGPLTDQLFVVVSREPIAGIPTGSDLDCPSADCLWTPDAKTWLSINEASGVRLLTSMATAFGSRQTPAEIQAVTRSVRLRPTAPAPSVVRANQEASSGSLVTRIDIRHEARNTPPEGR
jgi:hypothetical protein